MNDGASIRAQSFRREVARKAIHLSSTAVPLFLSLRGERAIALMVLGALAVTAAIVELARATSPAIASRFDMLFLPLLRPHESRHVTGATWLLSAMFAAVLLLPMPAAIAATWAAAVGDAAAALIGMRFGHHRSLRDGKSIEGSVACLLATLAGAFFVARLAFTPALLVAIAATIGERLPWPRDDNVRIIALVGATALIAATL